MCNDRTVIARAGTGLGAISFTSVKHMDSEWKSPLYCRQLVGCSKARFSKQLGFDTASAALLHRESPSDNPYTKRSTPMKEDSHPHTHCVARTPIANIGYPTWIS